MKAALAALSSLAASARASAYPPDPLQSPMWQDHEQALFSTDKVVFDPRVQVAFPEIAENQHVFPVSVDARALGKVRRMILLVDLNPIPIAVDYRPMDAEPFIATRIKLDQRTPVRGAVQVEDGSWHVSGGWIDAAGGGCSAPPLSRVKGDWAAHLGEMRGEAWPIAGTRAMRLRVLIRHPMDTGYVENVPAYHIEALRVSDEKGAVLGEMDVWASVSEDPGFTLMPFAPPGQHVKISARDTNGRDYDGQLIMPAAQT